MDANGQHYSDEESESAWPWPPPIVPIFRPAPSSNRKNREKTAHAQQEQEIKEEPVDEAPEPAMPLCEYSPRGTVAPPERSCPIRTGTPIKNKPVIPPLDGVSREPQVEDPLLAAQKLLDSQQKEIEELKKKLIQQEKELTAKFENELLNQKVKYLEEINSQKQQIIDLLQRQVNGQPTMNPPQLAAPAPSPNAPSLANSGRKTSLPPRENSLEPMEPAQKQRRQHAQEMEHQVKEGSSQSLSGLNQERDSEGTDRSVNPAPERNDVENYDVVDQPMEIEEVPDEAEQNEEHNSNNEQPVDNQEVNDLLHPREQPEQHIEENDEMGPRQNEGQELDANVDNDKEMDDEEPQIPPAGGLRRSTREKKPVFQITPKYTKKHITNQAQTSYERYKAFAGFGNGKKSKKYEKRADKCDPSGPLKKRLLMRFRRRHSTFFFENKRNPDQETKVAIAQQVKFDISQVPTLRMSEDAIRLLEMMFRGLLKEVKEKEEAAE
ncbi:hypothetical protein CRE_16994 [Caenorhabditis remanei]|uniref:Uncharacterized protein n=1 Tax=Caenorhabditis remanei TaxID=31234 RepID=E3N7V6_CAERE|nr:hypothetical protein CRE_16994 [Caenorhabditis remanei]